MRELWLYNGLSRFSFMNYRAKIMVVAFLGTHVPLIGLASYLALQTSPNWQIFFVTVGVTLIATLVGTGITLFVLNHLLRPVLMTSVTLRRYREARQKSTLPTHYRDEVGQLMADTDSTLTQLESARDALEHIDETTGLPNRKKLLQLIERQAALGQSFTLAVIRFANFSRIAETLDQVRADEAATCLAQRLESRLDHRGVIARINPSDFALLHIENKDGSDSWTESTDTLRSLTRDCEQDLPLDALNIKPKLRCGVARFPEDASQPEALLDNAIAAASQATLTAPVMLYSEDARMAAQERLNMEQELRRALDQGEFCLHYQPVVDLDTGKATGAEALIRWNHPTRGMVPPGAFIASAESSGLIEPIGLWVIQQACEQVRVWNNNGLPGMRVAVNISARQFLNPDLADHIERSIKQAGIEPTQIEIELTETSAMVDLAHTQRMFGLLRDLGIRIAIDDFGTGYGSMSYLRNLPFDKLKIDREFVDQVHQKQDSQAICDSLIALSQGLKLTVLAEGTEQQDEVNYLNHRGCNLFQGYFFAKPLPASEFGPAVNGIAASLERSHDVPVLRMQRG